MKSKSRTYLVIDMEKLEKGIMEIMGYFSIALKVLKIPLKLSKTKVKRMDGLYKNIENIPVYLIGQLAKSDNYFKLIEGNQILESAELLIDESFKIIGGRIILRESTNDEKILKFYIREGYQLLSENTSDSLVQLIKFII